MARTLVRLFQLWRVHAYLDLMWVTRDMKQFLSYYVSDAVINVAGVTAMYLLTERFGRIGPWSKPQILFMLGYALLVRGALETMFNYNVLWISRRLGRGQLDHTLVQPQPIWMALLTEGFCPVSGTGILLPGAALMAWAGSRMHMPFTPGWLGLAALYLLCSCAITASFSFLWGSLAFYAPRAAEEISTSSLRLLYQLRVFPLDGLSPVLLGGLMSALPVGLVAWYPCRVLLGLDPRAGSALVVPVAALIYASLAVFVFRNGLVHYGRVGSSRYLAFGHRR